MNKLKYILLCLSLLSLVSLSACNGGNEQDSESSSVSESVSVTESESTPASESDSESASESESDSTPTPSEKLEVGEANIGDDFAFNEIYYVKPTHKSNVAEVSGGENDPTLIIKFDSTFYGTESAVDRDTFHWGNIVYFKSTTFSIIDGPYVCGDFNGDRRTEQVYMDGTVLTMLKLPSTLSTGSSKVIFTQDLGEEMTPIGTGLFNDDKMTDLVLYRPVTGELWIGFGTTSGFDWVNAGALPDTPKLGENDHLFAGDMDGDGTTDLVLINDLTVKTYKFNGTGYEFFASSTLPFAESGQFTNYVVADINSDKCADVVATWSEVKTAENGRPLTEHYMRSYFSRRDGHFGSYESEGNNLNINPTCQMSVKPIFMAAGDFDCDGVDNILILTEKAGKKYFYMSSYPTEAPAYDYSSHVIKVDGGYILYSGGTYRDYNPELGTNDGDHLLAYFSKDGIHWYPNLDGAALYNGLDLGIYFDDPNNQSGDKDPETGKGIPGTGPVFSRGDNAKWWVGNTMEPEVIYDVNTQTYYMYYQCEAYCYNEDGTPMGADRIGVATSKDGVHFTRKTDSPALLTDDIFSTFTHQEVIYVPDDPDGKCWWMYVRYVHKNNRADLGGYTQHIRVRSDNPLCYDMSNGNYDVVDGFAGGIGNQVGYVSNYDGNGNRLFLRIIIRYHVTDDNGDVHDVPGLQYSYDGLNWQYSYDLTLAGADLTDRYEKERPNVCFLGFSTLNGTGEMDINENGEIEFFYVTCTTSSVVAPGIFYSSEGVGKVTMTITVKE